MKVFWSDQSRFDVERIRSYLFEKNPLAAIAVSETLFSAGNSLSSLPRRYAEREGGYREMVVSRYHYIIRYQLVADPENDKRHAALILSVWHPAQDR
ncbi:MAG: type II toxin-antitoxin system RelE/ParE family toxin [Alphaproteobacteria bacterium]|nr:type II toxin-antitoxin system RelE/ParE family toxin [Alphaproteobacteria bacterium]